MGIQFRLGPNDHKQVEDFLSREHAGTDAIILDTKAARHQAAAAAAAVEAGLRVYWEPAAERLADEGFGLDKLPLCTGRRPLDLGRCFMTECMTHTQTKGRQADDMGANALASTVSSAIERLGLTYEEVGDIVDASARSVARWTSGQVVPQRLNKQRLIELAYVADALAEVLPRDQANVWMFSPNRLLAHAKPADLVRDGEYQRVLALIDAMAQGIFV